MGLKLFVFCHTYHSWSYRFDALSCEILERNLTVILVKVHSIVGHSVAMFR